VVEKIKELIKKLVNAPATWYTIKDIDLLEYELECEKSFILKTKSNISASTNHNIWQGVVIKFDIPIEIDFKLEKDSLSKNYLCKANIPYYYKIPHTIIECTNDPIIIGCHDWTEDFPIIAENYYKSRDLADMVEEIILII